MQDLPTARSLKDHLGRAVEIPFPPQRVVSLCPSQTETLFALGLGNRIVGRTAFCVHPRGDVRTVEIVGGTKTVNMERIRELRPDLVIAEKEENTPKIVADLERLYPVYVTDVTSFQSALAMIRDLGRVTNREQEAGAMIRAIRIAFRNLLPLAPKLTTVYLIWRDPLMVAGGDTYIDSVLQRCGFENLFAVRQVRYPGITLEELRAAAPQVLLLASEPYRFGEEDRCELQRILPKTRIELVDGEMFTWYGFRMRAAPTYLREVQERLRTSTS